MGQKPFGLLLQRLRHLTAPSATGGLTDAELLERFVASHDEAAFEVLVWRHGAMVLGLCRRMLRHEHDAEDAFQATFLALVRKARSISKREALSSWLYKVAYRVALALRANGTKSATVRARVDLPGKDSGDEVLWRDLRPVLDEEVKRLPEKYRAPFVLCYLEGRTNEEAAQQLGCPRGTVLSRLARARERLRQRLTRRGLGLAVGLGATLGTEQGTAAVPAGLVHITLKAALAIATGKSATAVVSAPVAALTQGVLHAMFMTKLKLTLAVALAVGVAGVGAGALGNWGFADAFGPATADGPKAAQGNPGAGAQGDNRRPEAEDPVQAAVRRMKSQDNLKMIALAMHNFHDVNGHFPPPAIYGKDGKALLSWRVAILPYIDQDNLYKQFKLDEPWDSPHNKKLLAAMPTVYAPVGALYKEPDKTYYQVFVGPGAAFERGKGKAIPASKPKPIPGTKAVPGGPTSDLEGVGSGKGIRVNEFTDGTSNTILVVEARTPVPWTKPEDLPFVADQALPKLGGLFQGDFNAAFADGSVHWLSRKADPEMLRAAITRNGGEVIDFDRLHGTPPKARERKGEADRLPAENLRLREALEATHQEVAKMKEELKALKDLLAKESDISAAKAAEMRRENAALRDALEEARAELKALREEKALLDKELAKRLKAKK
jgi:RNA polymerase sigma factor (sigma-70 family)